MNGVRFWLTAAAAAILAGFVVAILTIPLTTITGTGPMPAAVLNLPSSPLPSSASQATPAVPRGSPQAVETPRSPTVVETHARSG